jgi:hypothetical protein
MTNVVLFKGTGQRESDLAGELAERLRDVLEEYYDRMCVASAVGALEIVKLEVMLYARENAD